jgi:sporulation protein YlmC with PRC-barrel domain
MKKLLIAMIVPSALTISFIADGLAQGTTDRPTAPPAASGDRSPGSKSPSDRTDKSAIGTRETWQNTQGLHETSTILGTRVKNAQGKDIGEIDQLLIDPKDGKVTHVVVGVGGLLGIGEKHVVVPWSDVKINVDHRAGNARAVVMMDQPTLERAPRYEKRAASVDRDRSSPSASPSMSPASPRTDHGTTRDADAKRDADTKRDGEKK